MKNPAPWFKWGMDLRFRNDTSINPYLTEADPPGHSYSFERLRLREWDTITPCSWLELNCRFTWEGRHYSLPDSKDEWDESDIIVDNLNFKLRLPELPVTLTVGRQDISFGEGWLISDGTPLDGPRTFFFDAVRATAELSQIKSTFDLIYLDQASSPNRWLVPFFSKNKPLMEQDERGVIAYFSNKAVERTQIDGYFIYKHDRAVLPAGDRGEVYTFGSRMLRDFSTNVSGRVEGAYQFGRRENAVMFPDQTGALSAWGLQSRLTYNFRDSWKNQLWLGYAVLSAGEGDDSVNHQFDPLWGRWAQYSELYPNDLDRTSDRSNVHRINLGYQLEPTPRMSIQANYHALFAYADRESGVAGYSEHGNFKGHLMTAILRYQFNRFWSGHVLGEYFIPEDYYASAPSGPLRTRRESAWFLRSEVMFTF